MGVIGSYLDVIFEVTNKRINTIKGISRTSDLRFEKLNIKNNKPIIDIEGIDTESFTFNIKLSRTLGVVPLEELAKWRVAQVQKRTGNLILGNKNYSSNAPLIIKKITDEHQTFDGKGDVSTIELSIELMECPPTKKQSKATAVADNTAPASKKTIGIVTIITDSMHVRAGAGINNKVLGYAPKWQNYNVYGTVNGWYDLGNGKYISANSKYTSFKGAT